MEELAVREGLQAVGEGPAVIVRTGVAVSAPGVMVSTADGPVEGKLQPVRAMQRMSRVVNIRFVYMFASPDPAS